MWLAQAKGKPSELIGLKPDIPAHVPVEEHEHILASLQQLGAILFLTCGNNLGAGDRQKTK